MPFRSTKVFIIKALKSFFSRDPLISDTWCPRCVVCLTPWLILSFMHLDMVLKPPPNAPCTRQGHFPASAFCRESVRLQPDKRARRSHKPHSICSSGSRSHLLPGSPTRNQAAGHECKGMDAPSEGEPQIRFMQSCWRYLEVKYVWLSYTVKEECDSNPGHRLFLKADTLSPWSP